MWLVDRTHESIHDDVEGVIMTKPKVIITGGGTAGHTNPGIAIGQALVAQGLATSDIHFVGGVRGNEETLVTEAGFSIDLLPGRGLQRKLSVQNLRSIRDLMTGLVQGFGLLIRRRPKAVVCLGGYAAFAVSAAAIVLRVPLVISEQNSRASVVNRVMGKMAAVSALPFPDTDLPKGVLTGNPIRPDVLDAVSSTDRSEARASFGVEPNRTMIAVWAGSLGATKINNVVRELAENWSDREDIALYHVVGKRDWHMFGEVPDSIAEGKLYYKTVEYENNMAALLAGADIAVCRSGASTVSELAVAGLPSVLVPLPNAPRDHQTANTDELIRVGGAVLLPNDVLNVQTLGAELRDLVQDWERRAKMAEAAKSVGRPSAAADVARLVLEAGKINE